MRVFLDTNVLVAAFAARGLGADLLRAVLAEHALLSSATIVKELTHTLGEKIRVPGATVDEIVAFLRSSAAFPNTASGPPPVAIRDSGDAVILSAALVLGADVLVTGDNDLLEAGEVPGIRILDPRGFWQFARGEET